MSRFAGEFATIDQLLSLATVRLFGTMGVGVTEAPEGAPRPPSTVVASAIGFNASGLRGAITLVLDAATVVALYPDLDLSAVDASRDACGEMSNMLVGELKTHMCSLALHLQLGLPVTMSGEGLQLFSPWSGMSSWTIFQGAHGVVRVRLDVQFTSDFAFGTETATEPSAESGEALFF